MLLCLFKDKGSNIPGKKKLLKSFFQNVTLLMPVTRQGLVKKFKIRRANILK